MTQREAIKLLKDEGFIYLYTGRHIYYGKNGVKAAVPNHKGDLKPYEVVHIRASVREANK